MNKKGMTIVELVVSFSLATVIALFLIEIVIFLKDTYVTNGIKSEMVLRQSLISDRINSLLHEQTITMVSNNCGEYCLELSFEDNSISTINFDINNNRVIIDDYVANLPSGSKIVDVNFFIENLSSAADNNDSIFSINAKITNDIFKDEIFNINAIYQFKKEETDLSL